MLLLLTILLAMFSLRMLLLHRFKGLSMRLNFVFGSLHIFGGCAMTGLSDVAFRSPSPGTFLQLAIPGFVVAIIVLERQLGES